MACTLAACFLSSFGSAQPEKTVFGPLPIEGDLRLVASDPDKLVRLTFREQEWLPALKWLADELRLNLDWQLLPTDTFSLHSTQEYSLKEAEDLINMQLLARGFTLLKRREILRVCPLKDMDITLVPHVEAEDLAGLSRHQFVRVSFSLDWMIAEQAAIEFKPLMSPFGGDVEQITNRFLNAWKNLSDTPVHTDNAPTSSAPPRAKDSSSVSPNGNSTIAASDTNFRFISRESSGGRGGSTPVRIVQGESGDLIVMAQDPVVAETAKRLLEQLIASSSELKVIYLKHSHAVLVKRQLEAMLAPTITVPTSKLVTATASIVTIEVDQRANRLLIQNATAKQLRMIESLIPTLDQAAPDDDRLVRKQKVHRFKHRKASEVLSVIKDVYRDLLSTNDRSFPSSSSSRSMNYNRNIAATVTNPEYQGILSVGMDEEANLLIISAPTYLIDEICELATSVDTASDGRAVSVVPYNSYPADTKARDMLSKIFSEKRK